MARLPRLRLGLAHPSTPITLMVGHGPHSWTYWEIVREYGFRLRTKEKKDGMTPPIPFLRLPPPMAPSVVARQTVHADAIDRATLQRTARGHAPTTGTTEVGTCALTVLDHHRGDNWHRQVSQTTSLVPRCSCRRSWTAKLGS